MAATDPDVTAILARRKDNGGDFWASPDGRIYVGNPFSTLGALNMLHELGVPASHEAVKGGARLILAARQDDGAIRLGPKAPLYPCYTAEAARILARLGASERRAARRAAEHLIDGAHPSGGWRCNFTRFGRGPETKCANPGATLYALDLLRFYPAYRSRHGVADAAVESLLAHWESRAPAGPCHWGIGTLFLQVEYPFLRYNLFYYVYVLSFFRAAHRDPRFRDALATLQAKLDEKRRVVVERPHRALGSLAFCAKGQPSARATARYREIVRNLGRADR